MNKPHIIVFANYNYLPVLENWIIAIQKTGITNYLIISLDEKLHLYLRQRSIHTLLRPCELDLGKLWIHRVEVILEFIAKGHDIIHSDADAIWLKDPLPYLNDLPQDMIFSQGTLWPPDIQKKWGFVLCCGFFMLRSNKNTLAFMQKLLERVKQDKDDQVSCNRLLFEEGLTWNMPKETYNLTFREHTFICSNDYITGETPSFSVALLPHSKFQRLFEECDNIFVRHLISEKTSEGIVDVLKNSACWFTE